MISPLPPGTHASLPPDIPAPQHSSPFAPLLKLWEHWKSFARAMGEFQSRILLGFFYFVVITPFGLGVRAFSDPLSLRRQARPSNWISRRESTLANLDEAKKQF